MEIPLCFKLLCLAIFFVTVKSDNLLTNSTTNTYCTQSFQELPYFNHQASNCSYEAQVLYETGTAYTTCLASGCNGTWQFSNADINGPNKSIPLYCCACSEATCSSGIYYTPDCSAAAGYMTTNNFGASFACYSQSCINLLQAANGSYECIDPSCTGTMVVQLLDSDPNPAVGHWVCQDPSCSEMASAAYDDLAPTNWYCADYCSGGGNKTYVEDYNETTNTITGKWQCSQIIFSPSFVLLFSLFIVPLFISIVMS